MNIPIETIIGFHYKRTQCHIDCVNYFAGLLGYHFPEHDNDKNKNPIQIGYAYINYAKYHHLRLLPAQQDAFEHAHAEHHKNNLHHMEHYKKLSEIAPITLIEMVCDWESANFEQKNILHDSTFESTMDWFEGIRNIGWTSQQQKFIENMIRKIDSLSNYDDIMKIWQPIFD